MKVVHVAGSDSAVRKQIVDSGHSKCGMQQEVWRLEVRLYPVQSVTVRSTREGGGRGRAKEAMELGWAETERTALNDA